MNRREEIEKKESLTLASYACKSTDSIGREYTEDKDDYRTEFQRDRDRIWHTEAFLRLQGKTQVFMVGEGDHYRNRLTHTTEVQQVGRDLARALALNEDLAESIALAHDLGHTPFGHAGQDALNEMMQQFGKHFEHNQQSKRVVEQFESPYPDFPGLNLTWEVREGLSKHTTLYDQQGKIQKINTLEAQVVNIADEISYHHHDIADGVRSGLISVAELIHLPLISECYTRVLKRYGPDLSADMLIKRLLKEILNLLIIDVIETTQMRIRELGIKTLEHVKTTKDNIVSFSDIRKKQTRELAKFLYMRVYTAPRVQQHTEEGKRIIKQLFQYLYDHPDRMLPTHAQKVKDGMNKEDVVKDYIAGMTDRFALEQYQKFFPRQKIKAIQMPLLGE